MRYSLGKTIDAFLRGEALDLKEAAVFTDGATIYSYNTGFPIAKHLGAGIYLFNNDKYSVTTSRHQAAVKAALDNHAQRIYLCNTAEIINARAGEPVILKRPARPSSLDEAMRLVGEVAKERGVKRPPVGKWTRQIRADILLARIRAAKRSGRSGGALADCFALFSVDASTAVDITLPFARSKDTGLARAAAGLLLRNLPRLPRESLSEIESQMPRLVRQVTGGRYRGSYHHIGFESFVVYESEPDLSIRDDDTGKDCVKVLHYAAASPPWKDPDSASLEELGRKLLTAPEAKTLISIEAEVQTLAVARVTAADL